MGLLIPELKATARLWRKMLYSKIMNIFEYDNLPEEIDEQSMKLFLFKTGKIVFYKINDDYICQPFAYTDKLNPYYIPTNGRVVNPWLPKGHQNWDFVVEDECVIYNCTPDIRNFMNNGVVSDLIWKTANQLSENDISYYCIQRNHRLIAIFTAENDLQKAEANRALEKMYEGKADIVMAEDLVNHIKVNPIAMNSTRSSITELIEFQQYILANFYHSFGINSNYNLKREQLNSNEIDVNEEVLRLNIDDMLRCREEGVSKINAKFGLNIQVRLNEEVYKSLLQESEAFETNESGITTGNNTEVSNGDSEGEVIQDKESTEGREDTQDEISEGESKGSPVIPESDEVSSAPDGGELVLEVETQSVEININEGGEEDESEKPEKVGDRESKS